MWISLNAEFWKYLYFSLLQEALEKQKEQMNIDKENAVAYTKKHQWVRKKLQIYNDLHYNHPRNPLL